MNLKVSFELQQTRHVLQRYQLFVKVAIFANRTCRSQPRGPPTRYRSPGANHNVNTFPQNTQRSHKQRVAPTTCNSQNPNNIPLNTLHRTSPFYPENQQPQQTTISPIWRATFSDRGKSIGPQMSGEKGKRLREQCRIAFPVDTLSKLNHSFSQSPASRVASRRCDFSVAKPPPNFWFCPSLKVARSRLRFKYINIV